MAIQVRRGAYKDFDSTRLLPGEWAVSIDNDTGKQVIWMCFRAGVTKRMGTYEDFKAQIAEILQPYTEHYDAVYAEILQFHEDIRLKHNEVVVAHSDIVNQYLPQIMRCLEETRTLEQAATQKAQEAANSAKSAKNSEDTAGVHMRAAAESERIAGTKASVASVSAANASNAAKEAEQKASEASASATTASSNAAMATEQATKALSSASVAGQKATEASNSAILAESFVHGGTGFRHGEGTDNAQYYSEQARQVLESLEQAGTVTGVKGSKETVYRTGNVNITAQNIGALSGDSISNSRGGAGIPMIVAAADADSGGLMEIGKYIDFHDIGSQTDFDARLYYDQGKLISTSPIQAPGGTLAGDLVFQGRGKKLYFGNESTSCPYMMCNNGSDSDLEIYAPSGYVSINDNLSAKKNSYFNGDVQVENQQKNISLKLGQSVAIDFAGTGFETSSASIGGGYPVFYGHGCIFGDNIDEGIMEYVARGHYYDHCFCSINENGKNLRTVTLSDGNVSCNTVNGKSADYAENWEWEDGNPNGEDRVGLFVTFQGSKIRISKKGDILAKVGVVSGSPCIIGDSDDGREWKHKYLKDVYGRLMRDEEGGQIINPAYDPDQTYISRSNRPEWDPIGTHGKLVVRDDGTCQADGFCVPIDGGVATAAEEGFYVMERLDESHIRIYMR